jgi:phage-related minor tail protein
LAGEIAAAYVSLNPSFQGGAAAIARELGSSVATAGADAGERFGAGFGDSVSGLAATGALFGGVAILATAFNQALAQADLPAALANQFGLAEPAAAEAAQTAAAVYSAGWGASLGEVGTAVGEVTRALDQLGQDGDVQALTQQAQALSDTFGQDVSASVNAAAQMVRNGLAPDMTTAMDIMVVGFQSGADSGRDLIDTITEYATQWRNLGIDGQTAMGLINQGMAAGARNSDILADALKEFSIRAIDGSTTTAAGFDALGLSVDEMAQTFATGGPEAAAALDVVLDRLRAMEDPVARDAAAVSLFGTTAEDLGDSLYALDPSEATAALGDFTGAASEVADATGESATAQLAAFGRTFTTGLADHIVPLLPHLQSLADAILPLTPILVGLAVAIGIAAVAMGLWRIAVVAAKVVMIGWRIAVVIATIVQWAWNIAMAANPIGLVVLAIIALIAIIAALVFGIVKLVQNWDSVVAALDSAWQWIKDQTSAIWNSIVDFVAGTGDRIVGYVEDHALEIIAAYNWLSELPGRVGGWFSSLADGAIEQGERLLDWAAGVPDWILSALGDLGDLLGDAGRDLVAGLVDGLESAYGSVRDSLQALTSSMTDWKGPPARDRRLFTPAGEMAIDSLNIGLERRIPRTRALLERFTADLPGMVRADLDGPTVRLDAADRELLARGDGVMVARIPIDLGDGVREVLEIELERHDARIARGALAGTGRVR